MTDVICTLWMNHSAFRLDGSDSVECPSLLLPALSHVLIPCLLPSCILLLFFSLVSLRIGHISDAHRLIGPWLIITPLAWPPSHNLLLVLPGKQTATGGTPILLFPSRSRVVLFWVSVPEGFFALLYSAGRYAKVLEPGLHVLGPFSRINYLISKQYTCYDIPAMDVRFPLPSLACLLLVADSIRSILV